MSVTGMNLTEVQHLVDQLRTKAEQLRALVSDVDARVSNTTWIGHDADTFKHQWWPGHRQRLLDAASHIHGLGQSAANNATEQEHASSRYGGATGGPHAAPAPAPAHNGTPTPPPVAAPSHPASAQSTAVATGAVDWAQGQLGNHDRVGECLGFVTDAWTDQGVNIRAQIDPAYFHGGDTYPSDIWGHFTHGTTGNDMNPPPGAFVFYAGTADHPRDYSHVTLSTGGGQSISTYDHVGNTAVYEIHPEAVDARGGRYLGWWLPAS